MTQWFLRVFREREGRKETIEKVGEKRKDNIGVDSNSKQTEEAEKKQKGKLQ